MRRCSCRWRRAVKGLHEAAEPPHRDLESVEIERCNRRVVLRKLIRLGIVEAIWSELYARAK
jgi:hypothetical protein